MGKLNAATDSNFENEVLQSEQPVLVDFWAVWCGPCRMIAPIVEQIANEYQGQLKVMKLDVDANQATAMTYRVMGIPTLILFKNGKESERITGYMPKERLLSKLRPHLEVVVS